MHRRRLQSRWASRTIWALLRSRWLSREGLWLWRRGCRLHQYRRSDVTLPERVRSRLRSVWGIDYLVCRRVLFNDECIYDDGVSVVFEIMTTNICPMLSQIVLSATRVGNGETPAGLTDLDTFADTIVIYTCGNLSGNGTGRSEPYNAASRPPPSVEMGSCTTTRYVFDCVWADATLHRDTQLTRPGTFLQPV